MDRCVPSEWGLSLSESLWYARRATRRGVVDVRDEWISPLRFLGVASGVKLATRLASGVAGSLPGKKSRGGLVRGGASMSTSSMSEVGKSTLGGEDMSTLWRKTRARRDAFDCTFRVGPFQCCAYPPSCCPPPPQHYGCCLGRLPSGSFQCTVTTSS